MAHRPPRRWYLTVAVTGGVVAVAVIVAAVAVLTAVATLIRLLAG